MPAGRLEGKAPAKSRFVTTHWSLVLAAGADSNATSRKALEELCGLYWQPLYYFIRRRGQSLHEAEDLLQGFFTHLLEKETLSKADHERGRLA